MGYEVIRKMRRYGFASVHGIRVTEQGLDGGADPNHDGIWMDLKKTLRHSEGRSIATIPDRQDRKTYRQAKASIVLDCFSILQKIDYCSPQLEKIRLPPFRDYPARSSITSCCCPRRP